MLGKCAAGPGAATLPAQGGGGRGADLGKACGLYQNFRALSCIDLLADAPDYDTQLQTLLTNQAALPTRLWTNAYLAALAQSAGLRLVSFDKDFARFVNAKNPKLLKFRISGTSKMHLT